MPKALKTVTVAELRKLIEGVEDDVLVGFEVPSGDYWKNVLLGTIKKTDIGLVEYSEYHRQFKVLDAEDEDVKDVTNHQSVLILS